MGVDREEKALNSQPDERPFSKKASGSKGKKSSSKPQPKVDTQPYDNDIKALFGQDGAHIVPELVAGAQVLAAQNVEVDCSKLKVDLVFQILYQGLLAILNIELQSGLDPQYGVQSAPVSRWTPRLLWVTSHLRGHLSLSMRSGGVSLCDTMWR